MKKFYVAYILFFALLLSCFLCLTSCEEDEKPAVNISSPSSEAASSETDSQQATPTQNASVPTEGTNIPTEQTITPTSGNTPNQSAVVTSTAIPTQTPTQTPAKTPTASSTPASALLTKKPDYNTLKKAELPRVDIKTEGGKSISSKEEYVKSTISLSGCKEEYAFSNSPAGVRIRGNSTAAASKKPYRIKFDKKQSFLGLNNSGEYKSWCLMADYYDGSMLRTWATFKFADVLLENKYYSADCAHVEVYINGKYNGVYLLCEQTQINEGRIDIPEKKDGDTSTQIGYLLIGQGGRTDEPETVVVYPEIKVHDRNGETMYFSAMNFALSGSDYTDEQKEYVSDYVSGVFKVVAKAVYDNEFYTLKRDGTLVKKTSFKGKTLQEKQIETIDAVFNIESAVRMCVLDEIAKNLDAMTFNMYVDLSPSGDGRLTLAAPWDFDFAMANTHYSSTHGTSGFYATNLTVSEGMRTNLWHVMLGSIDWFEEMCSDVWMKHYAELKSIAFEVYSMSYIYSEAFERDYDKWGLPANRQLIHHHCEGDLKTFKKHLDAGEFLGTWLVKRLAWLDRQWGNTEPDIPVVQMPDIKVDFTKQENMSYINGFRRCEAKWTSQGVKMTTTEGRDPYFYVDFRELEEVYEAGSYPYLEIECMIPETNDLQSYSSEIFMCAGAVSSAEPGVSTQLDLGAPTGKMVKYRVNLGETGFWEGQIHRLRFDFFNLCGKGDYMIIKSFCLKSN